MLRHRWSTYASPYLGIVFVGTLSGCTDPASNLDATVTLKRGAFMRVINLTDESIKAQAGDRPVAVATPPETTAPFVLIPPKMNKLKVAGGSDSVEIDIKLEPEKNYSFVCYRVGKSLRVVPIGDTPVRASEKGGPVIVVFNALEDSASIDILKDKVNLPTLSVSKSMNLALTDIKLTGSSNVGKIASNTVKPVFDGAYLGVIYQSQGKPAMQIFHTNPPMDVAGSSR